MWIYITYIVDKFYSIRDITLCISISTYFSKNMFIFYDTVTNWHQLSSAKQYTFLISQFPWVRSSDTSWLSHLFRTAQVLI